MGTRGETTMAFVNIERKEGGYAVIYLAKEPVNSMDLELWKQIRAAFAECEADSTINGVIFASGLKKDVFTAGLDLKELYALLPRASFAVSWQQRGALGWTLRQPSCGIPSAQRRLRISSE